MGLAVGLHLSALPKEQLDIYPRLREVTNLGFVLFGGTAVALQLGHRQSIDFDFFCASDISGMQNELLNLRGIDVAQIITQEPNTLIFRTNGEVFKAKDGICESLDGNFQTKGGVKLSFFGGLEFVKFANVLDGYGVKLADLKSLLVTKLKATCDRAEFKDYIDIVAILQSGKVGLSEALGEIPRYFGEGYPLVNIVKGLTYFEDGDLHRLGKEHREFLCREVGLIDFHSVDFKKPTSKKKLKQL